MGTQLGTQSETRQRPPATGEAEAEPAEASAQAEEMCAPPVADTPEAEPASEEPHEPLQPQEPRERHEAADADEPQDPDELRDPPEPWAAPGQPETGRRPFNSLMWALLIPLAAVAAGFLSQYPFGMLYVGILITLVVVATTAIIAGGVWNRAGAATLASAIVFLLPFFAGPTVYELYSKQLGRAVDAVIADDSCRAVDMSGAVEILTERQNCLGQFTSGEHVVLFKDPFGVLHPWVERSEDRTVDKRSLATVAGLFALATVLILYAGLRRRTDAERFAAKHNGAAHLTGTRTQHT